MFKLSVCKAVIVTLLVTITVSWDAFSVAVNLSGTDTDGSGTKLLICVTNAAADCDIKPIGIKQKTIANVISFLRKSFVFRLVSSVLFLFMLIGFYLLNISSNLVSNSPEAPT
jgi:hypothetical protein